MSCIVTGKAHLFLCKAGRTLDNFMADFQPDLHPRMIGGVTRFEACRKQYFVQKILYCVVSLYYLSAPDRDGASPNSNCKYETCLIFSTLDQSASDVIPMIANESEQASLTGCCASIAETWQPQTCRESREHHPYSLLFFVTFHLASLREITCHFLQSSSVWSHGLVESSSVCVQWIIRLKIG